MKKPSAQIFPPWTLLFLFLVVLGLAFQGSRGIWQPDEGYYSGVAETMLEKKSFVIPYLGEDEIFLDKPPLVYWAIIAGVKLFGHNEFAVRFFNGVSFALTALAAGLLGFLLFGDKRLGFLTSVMYATMVVPFFAANFVTPDTFLTLWTTVAAVCFWKSIYSNGPGRNIWKLGVCISVGLGFLTKGPAVLIPCGGMFVFLLITKRARRYFLNWYTVVCFAVFCAVGLSWYILISMNVPGALAYIFHSHVWGRLFSGKFERNPGLVWSVMYLAVLSLGSLPWTAVWLEKDRIRNSVFRKSWWYNLNSRPETLFLVTLFFVPLIILCLASSKLGLYALPLFAPLSIATARQWQRKLDSADVRKWRHSKLFIRGAVLTAVWSMMLIFSKLGLAYYPSRDDMRELARELKEHVGTGNYEVCTISHRADGLLFYGIRVVEHLTYEYDPYPTFTPTEYFMDELREMMEEKDKGFFLVPDDYKTQGLSKLLSDVGVRSSAIKLSHGRRLMALRWGNGLIKDNTSGKEISEKTE